MKKTSCLLIIIILLNIHQSFACTNIIVTKGASTDGSNMIAYTCDGEFHPHLKFSPAQDYNINDSLSILDYAGNVKGKIAHVLHTYRVMGYHNMNEYQVAMGETTFGGREELENSNKFLNYWSLMNIALQRSKTAREAIEVMTSLVSEYGYASSGESFSICDKNEAWLLEMIGTGGEGAIWVAIRIPDGSICAHANKARIGTFPLDDPENCIYSENVISFAIEKGYYNPATDGPFQFNETYDPATPENLRYCETRVWSIFRRAAPGQDFSPDYHRAVLGAERYPLYITPDRKLGVSNIMNLIRDHYEGTEFDMTKGLSAGPFGNPNRWRPLVWEIDNKEASWERCISTYNTGFSIITQSRSWLPDMIGGVIWYGLDDTYFTCYAPVYVCMDSVPQPFITGNLKDFNMNSAWWVFNLVSNYANTKFSYISEDVRKIQNEIESSFINKQDSVETMALDIFKDNKSDASKFLSEYSKKQLGYVYDRWYDLSGQVISKYNDGYIKNERGRPENAGYPEDWRKRAILDNSGYYFPAKNDFKKAVEPQNY